MTTMDFLERYGTEGDEENEYQLHDVIEQGDIEQLKALLKKKSIDPTQDFHQSQDELTDLHEADNAALLPPRPLETGPKLSKRDDNNCTPLHIAILNGQLEALRLLLEAGARVASKLEGSLPLHMVVCVGAFSEHVDFVIPAIRLLVAHGAVVLDRDDHGRTGLHWAACSGLINAAKELLAAARLYSQQQFEQHQGNGMGVEGSSAPDKYPALVEFQDKEGNTAMHLAARYRHDKFLAMLLEEMRANPEERLLISRLMTQRNKQGQNALHMAAIGGNPACVQLLLDAGTSNFVSSKNRQGRTVMEIAARRGHVAVVQLLQEFVQRGPTGGSTGLASVLTTVEGHVGEAQQKESGGKMNNTRSFERPFKRPSTLIMAPPECLEHHTCPWPIIRGGPDPPPENVDRLTVLLEPGIGSLRTVDFADSLYWDERTRRAALGDILRVHDWAYIRKIQEVCEAIPDDTLEIGHLDGDTAVSHRTFRAALAAAGAACHAVDELIMRRAKNAFCAVRPPGHHAGPAGVVTSSKDPNGSHGFCLFNNAAIAAAYAMTVHRASGVRKVAILDFDVHHGNGTEACVANTVPSVAKFSFSTAYGEGVQQFPIYKPWFDVSDRENIFFASVQGYGPKMPGMLSAYVYPGSGATCDTWEIVPGLHPKHDVEELPSGGRYHGGLPDMDHANEGAQPAGIDSEAAAIKNEKGVGFGVMDVDAVNDRVDAKTLLEDPDKEFVYKGGEMPRIEGPRIIDVGIPGPGPRVALWRRSWRDKVLPALVRFDPDLIVISAGFDAHRKDEINFSYIGVQEKDFEWLTDQIVQVANRCCEGRIISVLEGGYRIQGGIVSAFARSVAAHVRALSEPNEQHWDPQDAHWEREHEKKLRAEAEARRIAAEEAARAAQRAAAEAAQAAAEAKQEEIHLKCDAGELIEGLGGIVGEHMTLGDEPLASGPTGPYPADALAASIDWEDGHRGRMASDPIAPDSDKDRESEQPAAERRKRRRGAVDYVALNKKLEEEAKAKDS